MSAFEEPEVYEVLRKIRYDLTAAQAKITDAFNLLGQMNLAPTPKAACPECSKPCAGAKTLAEHRYTMHGVGELCVDCGRVADEAHACSSAPEGEAA